VWQSFLSIFPHLIGGTMATSQRCCHLTGKMLNSAAECADRARIRTRVDGLLHMGLIMLYICMLSCIFLNDLVLIVFDNEITQYFVNRSPFLAACRSWRCWHLRRNSTNLKTSQTQQFNFKEKRFFVCQNYKAQQSKWGVDADSELSR
jgi:hypothetical protein